MIRERFRQLYGEYPAAVYSAAGRVNLIGEHIDYCGGKVLPAALSLCCRVAVRPNGTNFLRISATDLEQTARIDLCRTEDYRDLRWWKYHAGVAHTLKQAGYALVGCDLLFDCTVPFGSGLSSSAAIEVATAYALAKMGGNAIDKRELAVLCREAERGYCGVSCGIMDQFASANGKKGCAILLDCATLESEYIPIDLKDCVLVLADCNKPHSLLASKYNERIRETETAQSLLSRRLPIGCLAALQPYELEEYRRLLPAVIYRRARHVTSECMRVQRCVNALKAGDLSLFGELLNASHRSLRDDYEVTGFELDTLAEEAWERPECLGSRMTGAGFGGCTVSLVKRDGLEDFIARVGAGYLKKTGREASFYIAEIADGIIEEDA